MNGSKGTINSINNKIVETFRIAVMRSYGHGMKKCPQRARISAKIRFARSAPDPFLVQFR